jgi:hypothetical protein
MNSQAELLRLLASVQGARFASFTYTSKGTGEVAKYRVNLGVNVENLYNADLETLEAMIADLDGIELEAAVAIRDSIKKSLAEGIGNHPDYRVADSYVSFPDVQGVKVHEETGALHLLCIVEEKEVIQEGVYKQVNSRPLTLAKKAIERKLRRSKIRQFILPNLSRAALQGEVLVFD